MTNKYRLYYNSDGSPKYYSMEKLKGKFIYVDQQTFQNCRYDIVVIDKKIKFLNENMVSYYKQFEKETSTSIRTDPTDISIIVSKRVPHILWDYVSSV